MPEKPEKFHIFDDNQLVTAFIDYAANVLQTLRIDSRADVLYEILTRLESVADDNMFGPMVNYLEYKRKQRGGQN